MEESNNKVESKERKGRFILLILLLFLVSSLIGTIFLLVKDNNDLENEVIRKDELIIETRKLDSLLYAQRKNNESTIEKYISGCNILIDGKEVTTEQLVSYMNKQIVEINKLNEKIFAYEDSLIRYQIDLNKENERNSIYYKKMIEFKDSLEIYKSFYSLAKRKLQTDFTIRNDDSAKKRYLTLTMPVDMHEKDSFFIYKSLYQFAQKDYGLAYDYTFKDGKIIATDKSYRLDSALVIFEYYKDRLKKDKNGDWLIKTPLFYKKPK